MKKRLIAAVCVGLMLCGCGNDTAGTPDGLAGYVELAEISGLNPQFEPTVVTEEEVDEAISDDLDTEADYSVTTDPIVLGDYILIDMTVKADGKLIYDYTGEEYYDMVVGGGEWGEDFENSLVGKKTGDTGTWEGSFPIDFEEDSDLAGRNVSIDYEIREVENVAKPELTEAFAKEKGYASLEAYRDDKRFELEKAAAAEDVENYKTALMEELIKKSTFKELPDSLKKEAHTAVESDYLSFAEMFGMTLQDAYDTFGITDEDVKADEDFYAKQLVVVDAINKKFNVTISDDEFADLCEDFAMAEEYEDVDDLMTEYTKDELMDYFMYQKAYDILLEKNPRS